MARVQMSAMINTLFGSVGPDTYSHTRAYLIIKKKSFPGSVHPFTPSSSQVTRRNAFKASIARWKTLTPDQITAWCTLASTVQKSNRFTESYYQAGFNLFLELMQNMQMIGHPIYSNAPAVPTFSGLTEFTVQFQIGPPLIEEISLGAIGTASNVRHLIYATKCLNPGITYAKKYYRFIAYIPQSTATSFNILSAWTSLFGVPILNSKIFLKLIPIEINTGFSTINIFSNTIVIA